MKTLTYDELKQMTDRNENFFLINVLPESEFKKTRIPNSLNIPFDQPDFIGQVERAAGGKSGRIVVHCSSFDCPKSHNAAVKLEDAGFTDVSAYEGGTKEWMEKSGGRAAA